MDLLIIDNYDSFTYNIAHIVRNHAGVNLTIIQAGKVRGEDIKGFEKIIFSPGPDLPLPGNCMEMALKNLTPEQSVLGICLGLQAIYLYFGGELKNLEEPVHGRTKKISTTSCYSSLFDKIPEIFAAGLYHSWIADIDTLPDVLEITALSPEKRIMAIKHKYLDIEGVQFHPESVMTPYGKLMLHNWMESK